jgi:transposase-like protein
MKREKELQEFRYWYKRGWAFIDISQIHLPNVPLSVLRKWRRQYFHTRNNYTNQKKHFKAVYPLRNKSLTEFAKDYGVTRQTLTKWKNEIFPEITTKEHLFIKLIEKNDLTVNELSKLLGMTRTSVLRFIQDYKGGKMQGIAPPVLHSPDQEPGKSDII